MEVESQKWGKLLQFIGLVFYWKISKPLGRTHSILAGMSLYLIVKLSISSGYYSAMVVVDKNTKLGHFSPTHETIDSQETASLYLHHVWKHHGTPYEVISVHEPIFVSKFMKRLSEPSLIVTLDGDLEYEIHEILYSSFFGHWKISLCGFVERIRSKREFMGA